MRVLRSSAVAEARRAKASTSLISRVLRVVAAEARNRCSTSLRGRRVQRRTRLDEQNQQRRRQAAKRTAPRKSQGRRRASSLPEARRNHSLRRPPCPRRLPRTSIDEGSRMASVLLRQARRCTLAGKDLRGRTKQFWHLGAGRFATRGGQMANRRLSRAGGRGAASTRVSLRLAAGTVTKCGVDRVDDALRLLLSTLRLLVGLAGLDTRRPRAHTRPGFEIRAGVLAHDVPDLWSGFRLESGVDINAELLGPGIAFLGGTLRPAIGAPSTPAATPARPTWMRAGRSTCATASSSAWVSARRSTTASSIPCRSEPQGAWLARAVPHSLRARLPLRRAPQPLGLLRAHVERQLRRPQRGARQHRHPLRLPLLTGAGSLPPRHPREAGDPGHGAARVGSPHSDAGHRSSPQSCPG